MLNSLRPFLLPAGILIAGLALNQAVLADTAGTPAAPPAGGHAHQGHRWRMPAFARALHQVRLTDAQKSQIHTLLRADHEAMRAQFESLRDQHLAFDRAVPGTSDFTIAQANLLQAETAAVQTHLQHEADLHTKIYALLTDDQKTQLATALTQIQNEPKDTAGPDAAPPPND